jgi:hypothetical protein
VNWEQALKSEATSRPAAETGSSWLDLFNFMRIFRHGPRTSGPKKSGLESNPKAPREKPRPAFGYVL